MRISFLLLAASGHLTRADGFLGQEPEGAIAFRQPRQTGASAYDAANGWTPRPTDGPLVVDGANALEIARRRDEWMRMRRQESNTWINEETCGWRAGTSCMSRTPTTHGRLPQSPADNHPHSFTLHLRGRPDVRNKQG